MMCHEIRKQFISVFLFFLLSSAFCFATVTATYTPETNVYFSLSPGPFTSPTVIGSKIGTLVITSDSGAGTIYTPGFLNITGVTNITMTGQYREEFNEYNPFYTKTNLLFGLVVVSYPNGVGSKPVLQPLYGNTTWPIISQKVVVAVNPLVVEIYLVNTNSDNPKVKATLGTDGQHYKLDSTYAINGAFSPAFTLAVAQDANTNFGWYSGDMEGKGEYISVNGNNAEASTSFVGTGIYSDSSNNGMIYGDKVEEPTPELSFYFADTASMFSIAQAIGSNKAVVTQANITLTNGVSGQTYTQKMTFTDNAASTTAFQLTPDRGTGTALDFDLYLGNDQLTKGVSYYWTGITNGINMKDLKVGGIDATAAANGASGTYRDTITVSFTTLP